MTENLKTSEFNIEENTLDISEFNKEKNNIPLSNRRKDIGESIDNFTFGSFPLKRKKDIGGSDFNGIPLKRKDIDKL
ncbi:hypothetical protein H9660_06525 [Clostridium sp. Sa3CUN1]|uniref:Uncharacterized protein n=1 Tax=Clostridium gallinarum TaxID=2762246 RepID=A0ABR8Q302_9CLOT|nr:hypothetical protein [Clostridium gallinarum]MBD7914797.1 hypothetical protein [Clostridium gallinarum]